MVVQHGLGGDSVQVRPAAIRLAAKYGFACLCPDFPCHGRPASTSL